MTAALAPLIERWRPDLLPRPPGRTVVPAGLRAFLLAGMAAHSEGPVVAIIPGERDAEELVDDLRLFSDAVFALPAWETLPFEHVSPNLMTMANRSQARHMLVQADPGTIVVASVRAATQRLSPSTVLPLRIEAGRETDRDELIEQMGWIGYHRTDRVETRGEFAVRGGIVDVFPAQGTDPVRLEFWGDVIEEVRFFEVAGQRSSGPAGRVAVYPAREFRPETPVRELARRYLETEPWAAETWDCLAEGVTFAGMESWLPWLAEERTLLDEAPPNASVVLFDPVRARDRSRDLIKEEQELAAALAPTWGHGAPDAGRHPALYLPLDGALAGLPLLDAPPAAAGPEDSGVEIRGLDAVPGDAESVAKGLNQWLARDVAVVVAMDGAPAADRVARLLGAEGLELPRLD